MEEIKKIYKKLQLENSIFKGSYMMSKEMNLKLSEQESENIAFQQMSSQLAKKIIEDHGSQLVKEDSGEFNRFSIDLLVINKSQLKNIVEGVILMMSDNQIAELRK